MDAEKKQYLASGENKTGCLCASAYNKLGGQEMFSGSYLVIEETKKKKSADAMYWDGGQICGTLTANNASGAQRMPDKENFNCVICLETYHCTTEKDKTHTLKPRDYKDPLVVVMDKTDIQGEVLSIDRAAFNQGENALYDFTVSGGGYCTNDNCERSGSNLLQKTVGALCFADYKFPQQQQVEQGKVVVEMSENENQYIVRRLTPLECCRLQGFPDGWAEIDYKEEMTEEEYLFWKDVRQTYDKINGRIEKDYSEKQILTWYNKLHTDSAEYKMWGNGLALPNALYVMQGIAELWEREHEEVIEVVE